MSLSQEERELIALLRSHDERAQFTLIQFIRQWLVEDELYGLSTDAEARFSASNNRRRWSSERAKRSAKTASRSKGDKSDMEAGPRSSTKPKR